MRFAVVAAALGLLLGCEAATLARQPGECLDASFRGAFNAFPSQFQVIASAQPVVTPVSTTVTIAKDFQVAYFPTYKLITNTRAGKYYALYQCGMDPPPASELPVNTTILSIPLTSVAVEDATALAFMVLLGVEGRISYVSEYAVNPCMQSLGQYGCKRVTAGVSNGYADIDTSGLDGILGYQKSDKTITVSASPDPGPLNRAEWIKYVATFFNKEDVANTVFAGISERYNSLKAAVVAQAVAVKPQVAWIYFQEAQYGDPDQVQISFTAYKDNYTTDAGGRMLNLAQANATALKYGTWNKDVLFKYNSLVLTNFSIIPQQLREILADTEVIVEETRFTKPEIRNVDLTLKDVIDLYGFKAEDVQALKFLKNNKVLREDAQSNPDGYTDWFEMGTAQPDLVLRDLAAVVTPAVVPAGTTPRMLRLLGKQPAVLRQASECKLQNCILTTSVICPLVYRACDGTIVAATAAQRCAPVCTPGSGTAKDAAPAPPPSPLAAGMTSPLMMSTLLLACTLALILAMFA